MKLYFTLYLAFLFSVSLGCKERSQEYRPPTEVLTTVVVDAAAPEDMPSLMTMKYCGTHGVKAGKIYNMITKTCECKRGSYDPKIGMCVEKTSSLDTVYPHGEETMDSHGPTAEERAEELKRQKDDRNNDAMDSE